MEKFDKGKITPSLVALLLCFGSIPANAAVALFDFGFNIDGTTTFGGSLPPDVDGSGFDFGAGLGIVDVTISGAGLHYVGGFFDHEIDEPINSFFNEIGSASGALAAGQSWEIDEPGFVFGDIDLNLVAGTLDDSVGVPFPDDVSMAMGWDFALALGEEALISFAITDVLPASPFFLTHSDLDSPDLIYMSSTLDISLSPIPVPAAIWLFGSGLVGLVGFSRRKQKSM
jgi:hypothetical protein